MSRCTSCGSDKAAWFDRELCPEPCGAMHYRCVDCGNTLLEDCLHEARDAMHAHGDISITDQLGNKANRLKYGGME